MDLTGTNKEMWDLKENSFTKIDNRPICFFIDGRDVTKNHEAYKLMGEDNFTECLFDTAKELVKELKVNANIFSILDETTIIFHETSFLKQLIGVGDAGEYLCSILTQRFCKKLWKKQNVFLKTIIFNIDEEKTKDFLDFRYELTRNAVAHYYIKEKKNTNHLDKEEALHPEETIKLMGYWKDFTSHDAFINGYKANYDDGEFC